MSKKLLFITTRVFYPTNSGRKLSLYHYCRGLHEKYGYSIQIYTFLEGDQDKEIALRDKPYFIDKIYFASEISVLTKIKNILFKSLWSKHYPLQCALYHSKNNFEKIYELCKNQKYDVVITDMIRTAQYISSFIDCKIKILDMDDLLSLRYKRELSTSSDPNFIGQYSKKLPKFINKLLPIFKRIILSYEIKKLNVAEKYYANLYDKVVFVSDRETMYLNKKLGTDKCITITTGVDYKFFSSEIDVKKEKNSVSFVGNFEYPPNVDSLRMIVHEVLPHVRRKIKIYAIGKVNDPVKKEFEDKIIFLGMVDDIRKYVHSTVIFLSPIAYGTGIKTKILEAMAMGMPVITNSVGAEGINIINGVNAIVSDDMKKIAYEVERLLDNSEECKRLGKKAKKTIAENYQWEEIWKKFRKCGVEE